MHVARTRMCLNELNEWRAMQNIGQLLQMIVDGKSSLKSSAPNRPKSQKLYVKVL